MKNECWLVRLKNKNSLRWSSGGKCVKHMLSKKNFMCVFFSREDLSDFSQQLLFSYTNKIYIFDCLNLFWFESYASFYKNLIQARFQSTCIWSRHFVKLITVFNFHENCRFFITWFILTNQTPAESCVHILNARFAQASFSRQT